MIHIRKYFHISGISLFPFHIIIKSRNSWEESVKQRSIMRFGIIQPHLCHNLLWTRNPKDAINFCYLQGAPSTTTFTIIRNTNNCPWIRCIPVEVNNLVPECTSMHHIKTLLLIRSISVAWQVQSIYYTSQILHHSKLQYCAIEQSQL